MNDVSDGPSQPSYARGAAQPTRRRTGALLSVVVGVAVLVLLTQFVGTPNRWVAALQSLTPFAVVPLAAATVAAARSSCRGVSAAALVTTAGYLMLCVPLIFAPGLPNPPDGAPTVTLLASNLLYSNQQVASAASELAAVDADVVALAEVTPAMLDELHDTELARRFPHRIEHTGALARGLVLWSRFPLDPPADTHTTSRSIDTRVRTPDGSVRLVFMHPPPPVFNRSLWHEEIEAIPALVAGGRAEPTVVLGDFNATHFHPPYRNAVSDAGLTDALAAVGQGFTMTWPTDEWLPPFVAIDHVLVDDRLAVVDAGILDVSGADHRAVWATLAFVEL